MKNPWDEINDLSPDVNNPADIIDKLFKPLPGKSNNNVNYKLQCVNFFPEEVTYSSSSITLDLQEPFVMKKTPHPEFGYNPREANSKQTFRYRLLFYPEINPNIEYELFKFKFPIIFYPVQFYIEENNFPEIKDYIKDDNILVNNEDDLIMLVSVIIQSETTIKLIRRLIAISSDYLT